jgi:hypothetical protein
MRFEAGAKRRRSKGLNGGVLLHDSWNSGVGTMQTEALFINGVFEEVLDEILAVQEALPEHIMFLQPYSSDTIVHLREDTPSVGSPKRLFLSTTNNLATVQYEAEIVGWDDKCELPKNRQRFNAIARLIWTLQPAEGGLYDASRVEGKASANLLHIRRLRKLLKPFQVSELIKTSDGQPISADRTTSGGWSYVHNPDR